MEECKILLIGNETDILHCGFSFPLSEGGKRYPSAYHYAHSMILTQLGLDEVHILELLATPSANVADKARELLQENMPAGHDMNSLAQYLTTSRQSYTMAGLRLRAEQDKRFHQALIETNEALLIVCDRRDAELGVGLDDEEFVSFTRRIRADAEKISQWMHDERQRPREVGQNQLGFFLMWLRYEIKEKERAQWMTTNDVKAQGLSTDQEDKPIEISVSDFVVALQGIFQPLSNYYAMNFEIKGETYRSVEHYAYQRLFESLKLSYADVMKIRTTVKPVDVAKLALKVFKAHNLDVAELEHKKGRLDRWRQSAMKHKITKNELLQQLLLSTGHSILIETAIEGDEQWASGTDEFELQHLLTKKYITPQLLIDWMCGRKKRPGSMNYLGGNKTGLLLMELRTKFAVGCTHRIPLVSPLATNVIRTSVSNHLICFTPESVLHPFYSCEVKPTPDALPLPSPVHCVAQAALKFFNVCEADSSWVMETKFGPECWSRLHYVITEQIMPPLDKIQQWYMTERQNAFKMAMHLQFEQNPQLLRILLDTADALLVSCARFSSSEAELTVGMRERDLRMWLANVRVDSKSMIDLCLRPMAFRPPYLGGNRLGIILMEIRRDFILKGAFPQQLPELPISADAALGSESPMENYVPHYTFDILSDENYTALWANAFLLMAKQEGTAPALWTKATTKKTAPTLLSVDETAIDIVMESFVKRCEASRNSNHHYSAENDDAPLSAGNGLAAADMNGQLAEDDESAEVMRAIFAKLAASIREKIVDDDQIQRQISKKSKENREMQEMRRAVERSREQAKIASAPSTMAQNYQWTAVPTSSTAHNSTGPASLSAHSTPNTSDRTAGNLPTTTSPSSRSRNGGGTNDLPRPRPHNQLDPFSTVAKDTGGKIPSLLSDFSVAAAIGGGMNAAAAAMLEKRFEKEFEKFLPKLTSTPGGLNPAMAMAAIMEQQNSNRKTLLAHHRSYDNLRGGRQYSSGGGGRRGGPQGGAAIRSPSPMTAYHQNQQNRRFGNQQQNTTRRFDHLQQHQDHQHSGTQQFTMTPYNDGDKNVGEPAVTKPPAPKKPKRTVDESELSEGEILSDEDDE